MMTLSAYARGTAASSGVASRIGTTAANRRGAPGTEEDVADRAVHGPRHQQGEECTGCADEDAGDDQGLVVEHEAGERRSNTRHRVEDGDDDWHVRATDGEDGQDADHQRGDKEGDDEEIAGTRLPEHDDDDREGEHRYADDGVDLPLVRI